MKMAKRKENISLTKMVSKQSITVFINWICL